MATKLKTVSESKIELSQLMRPQQANFSGNVHGGEILALMDQVAYTCASKFSEHYCVTVAIDMVEFLAPILVGDVVTLQATVINVGRSSMDIGIKVLSENPRKPDSGKRTNRCFMTMVAMDDNGKPTEVPRLKLECPEDHKWNAEALLRKKLRKAFKEEMEKGIEGLEVVSITDG